MSDETKDLGKEEEKPQEEESTSEESTQEEESSESNVSEDVENSEDEDVSDLLSDGTSTDKKVTVNYKKFQELNESKKLLDQFSPLLAKLQNKPEVVEELLNAKSGETVEERVIRLEKELTAQKRKESETVLREYIKAYPNFRESWTSMKPIISSLEKQGLDYREAVRRAYLAINPEAMEAERKRLQNESNNEVNKRLGTTSSSSSASKRVYDDSDDLDISDSDLQFAKAAGIDPKLYKKHAAHIARFKDL